VQGADELDRHASEQPDGEQGYRQRNKRRRHDLEFGTSMQERAQRQRHQRDRPERQHRARIGGEQRGR
jgi:hypothetical protein